MCKIFTIYQEYKIKLHDNESKSIKKIVTCDYNNLQKYKEFVGKKF